MENIDFVVVFYVETCGCLTSSVYFNFDCSSNQTILYDHGAVNGLASTVNGSNAMESVLSLNDGRWSIPGEKFFPPANDGRNNLPVGIIRQPSPPPVLAQVQTEHVPISPSRVADPRPGPVKPFQEGASTTASYQHLHIVSLIILEIFDDINILQFFLHNYSIYSFVAN